MEFLVLSILTIGAGCLVFWFLFWIAIALPIEMAVARGRNAAVWLAVSLVGSPFAAFCLLWILGDARPQGKSVSPS
jgi:hypothetical protein